jgi:hypothetical protein
MFFWYKSFLTLVCPQGRKKERLYQRSRIRIEGKRAKVLQGRNNVHFFYFVNIIDDVSTANLSEKKELCNQGACDDDNE